MAMGRPASDPCKSEMRFFRVAYAVIALCLFLSLVALGVTVLLYPELAGEYLRPVLVAIVGGALLLLSLDLLARRMK